MRQSFGYPFDSPQSLPNGASANSEPGLNIVEGTASVSFRVSHFSLFVTKFPVFFATEGTENTEL